MRCPQCPSPLEKVGTQRQADACPRGHGVFLSAAEIGRLLDEPDARRLGASVLGSATHGVECPACGVTMRTVENRDRSLVLDGCPKCRGFWFDAGELERVQASGFVPYPQVLGFDLWRDPTIAAAFMGGFAGASLAYFWRR